MPEMYIPDSSTTFRLLEAEGHIHTSPGLLPDNESLCVTVSLYVVGLTQPNRVNKPCCF